MEKKLMGKYKGFFIYRVGPETYYGTDNGDRDTIECVSVKAVQDFIDQVFG